MTRARSRSSVIQSTSGPGHAFGEEFAVGVRGGEGGIRGRTGVREFGGVVGAAFEIHDHDGEGLAGRCLRDGLLHARGQAGLIGRGEQIEREDGAAFAHKLDCEIADEGVAPHGIVVQGEGEAEFARLPQEDAEGAAVLRGLSFSGGAAATRDA